MKGFLSYRALVPEVVRCTLKTLHKCLSFAMLEGRFFRSGIMTFFTHNSISTFALLLRQGEE